MEQKKYDEGSDPLSDISGNFPDDLGAADAERLLSIHREFTQGFAMMKGTKNFVTIFGSKSIGEGRPEYALGRELGAELARNGYAVLTGGGPGLMEAVNRGAKEADGKSMGINIDIEGEQESNPYADPAITIKHFFVRKVLLLKYSSAYVFLPGGFGTLDELFETVTLMQTKKIKPFPIVLFKKEYWAGLIGWMEEKLLAAGLVGPDDLKFFRFAETAREAVTLIRENGVVE